MIFKQKNVLYFVLLALVMPLFGQAQITGLGHNASSASNFPYNDSIYIYCSNGPDDNAHGMLEARSPFVNSSEFNWEKYDSLSGVFEYYSDGIRRDSVTSQLRNLDDGCYRVTISSGGNSTSFQAWVLHNWITVEAEIPDSTSICEYFKIVASYEMAPLNYYDLQTNERISIRDATIQPKIRWSTGSSPFSSVISPIVFDPPASNTDVEYKMVITDNQFACSVTKTVMYESKTTLADFTYDPPKGEAVLEVTFANNSINYDSVYWLFSKNLNDIKAEIAKNPDQVADSLDFILTDDAPTYTYEWSGKYKVTLVSVKINPTTGNCRDTLYMSESIEVAKSLIFVPNYFTPNGDGVNEEFMIQSQSLKSLNIRIYNRWGALVHSWKYSNIRSNDYTQTHSVWDGRIGRRMASPGVYFYVVSAVGRDGEKLEEHGFFHLFRGKN